MCVCFVYVDDKVMEGLDHVQRGRQRVSSVLPVVGDEEHDEGLEGRGGRCGGCAKGEGGGGDKDGEGGEVKTQGEAVFLCVKGQVG